MQKFKDFAIMTVGCVLLTIGVYFFKIPNGFVTGGISGLGTLLAKMTAISAGTWIWGLNAVLLVVGFLLLGKDTGIKTVYCSMLYSALIYLLEYIVPVSSPLTDQPFLELIYAILLTAIGSALIFNSGASSGGTDIVALLLKKYTSLDVGKSLLAVDSLIALSSFYVFGVKAGLYSMLGLFAKATVIDGVIESFNTCKYFIAITDKPDEISEFIMNTLHHGATVGKAVGYYTKEDKYMVHTVCKRLEAIKLRSEIKKIDSHAFIIITTTSEIIGRGFRSV